MLLSCSTLGDVPDPGIGELVRTWRARRSCSQLDLAIEVGVSPRHLSFVETGRSNPSAELVLALADHLDVPLRERNSMLLAAGFAPRFTNVPLDDEAMKAITGSLRQLLAAHDPYPGFVLDRCWNVLLSNEAGAILSDDLPEALREPPINLFRASLHPEGLAARTTNFPTWGAYLIRQLERLATATRDPELATLYNEVLNYPNVMGLHRRPIRSPHDLDPRLDITCDLELAGQQLSMFTTLTTFGTPQDITLDEIVVELFFPADTASQQFLRNRP